MHREKIAYAQGALVKLAEYNIRALAFCDAAVQCRDPQAIKVAELLAEYAVAVKYAGGGKALAEGAGQVADSVKNKLKGLAGEADMVATKAPTGPPPAPAKPATREALSEPGRPAARCLAPRGERV